MGDLVTDYENWQFVEKQLHAAQTKLEVAESKLKFIKENGGKKVDGIEVWSGKSCALMAESYFEWRDAFNAIDDASVGRGEGENGH